MTQSPNAPSDPGRFLWDDDDEVVCSPCMTCIHKYMDGPTCKAFPKGIPQAIISRENDHTQPYPGDHGIQYTPRVGAKRRFGW
ncbi:MAG: hypothetical protein M3Z04_25080 [Chloroflexota bacterium]|nr:hypothetical protein [Chloroflexota bacterium]